MNTDFVPSVFSIKNKEAVSKQMAHDELVRHGFVRIESALSKFPVYEYGNNIYVINFNYTKHRLFISPVIENEDKTAFEPRPGVAETVVWKSTKLGVFLAAHPKIFPKSAKKKVLAVAAVNVVAPKANKVKKSRKEEGLPFFINRYMRTVSNRGLSVNEYYYTMTSTNDSPRLRRDYNNVLKKNNKNNPDFDYSEVFQDFTKVVDEIPLVLDGQLNMWIDLETE